MVSSTCDILSSPLTPPTAHLRAASGGRETVTEKSAALHTAPHPQSPASHASEPQNILHRLRLIAATPAESSTAASRRKAINTFLDFTIDSGITSLTPDLLTSPLLARWMVWLTARGYSRKTALYYLRQLSAAVSTLIPAKDPDPFADTRDRLIALPEERPIALPVDIVTPLRTLLTSPLPDKPILRLARDILAFAILAGGLDASRIVTYRKDQYDGDDETLLDIVRRNTRPRSTYLFPLDRSTQSPAQLRRHVGRLFLLALNPLGLPIDPGSADTLPLDLWTAAALQTGIAPDRLLAVTGGRIPASNPALILITPADITPAQRQAIILTVSSTLAGNPLGWYAMQFRPRVTFADIRAAIDGCPDTIRIADLFYPMREIARRTEGRLAYTRVPVVPGLLFFRTRATDIAPLFRHIGHLAWCYRQTASPASPYALIPPAQMRVYQTVIGSFTPDITVHPQGTLPIRPGDRVVILGGTLIGREALVTRIITDNSHPSDNSDPSVPRTIYRLTLIGDNSIEWTLDTDPRMVKKE